MKAIMPHGKICYIEIPAIDIAESAKFYAGAFGWDVRSRGDGSTAFDDGIGNVSGTWVLGRLPARDGSLTVHIMVDSVEETLKKITATGGQVAMPLTPIGGGAAYATFHDPAGNLLGIYQEGRR
jgi:predicted enzyme related to lactoylglutathione lyase